MYSYPILSIQAKKSKVAFFLYGLGVGKLGLWKSLLFYVYFSMLLILGATGSDKLIKLIKASLGYTPRLGPLPRGRK